MKIIKLGIFDYLGKIDGIEYPFVQLVDNWRWSSILFCVHQALKVCDKCNFCLDGVILPINPFTDSYTCKELDLVLNTPKYLKKTIFWLNGNILSTEEALKYLNKWNSPLDSLIQTDNQ